MKTNNKDLFYHKNVRVLLIFRPFWNNTFFAFKHLSRSSSP